jgi:hypothetical protein
MGDAKDERFAEQARAIREEQAANPRLAAEPSGRALLGSVETQRYVDKLAAELGAALREASGS